MQKEDSGLLSESDRSSALQITSGMGLLTAKMPTVKRFDKSVKILWCRTGCLS